MDLSRLPGAHWIALGLSAPATDPLDSLRAALRPFPDGARRLDLLTMRGIAEGDWTATIDALVDSGEVKRTGRARGTRYHLARRSSCSAL